MVDAVQAWTSRGAAHGRMRGALAPLVLGAILLCTAFAGAAAPLALLVGVSRYPNLGEELQLKAPANDVRLMRRVLLQRGFDARRIDVLADGVDGAGVPDRASILAALRRLAGRAQRGDTVVLHFVGHGSVQRVTSVDASGQVSLLRWQPVFLPRDVRRWDGKSGPVVPNALTDTELRTEIDGINATGAFVFVVVDACHSARLVRGNTPGTSTRLRNVSPEELGLRGAPPPADVPAWTAAAASDSDATAGRGRAVYFYAAQSMELAASPMMTGEGGKPVWHGLFSWHVAQGIALGLPISYRQLGSYVLTSYDRLPVTQAAPLFSGDGLDQAVLGTQVLPLGQWMLERRDGQLVLPAGALAGITEGALLALLANPLAPSSRAPTEAAAGTLGYLRAVQVRADHTLLEPVAWQGWAAPVPAAVPSGSWGRLVAASPAYTLRVAVEGSACPGDCAPRLALERLRRDGAAGVDLRWVDPGDAPDAWLWATQRGVQLRLPADEQAPDARWLLAPSGVTGPEAVDRLALDTAQALHRVARARNLLRLAARLSARSVDADVRLTVRLVPNRSGPGNVLSAEQLHTIHPDDALSIEARNTRGDPVDFALLWLDADLGIAQWYPMDARDSPRLGPGERVAPGLIFTPDTRGTERLLVLSMPMRRGQEAVDFRFLEQSALTTLRGGGDPELQALTDAAFADYAVRGNTIPAPLPERLGMQVYTFRFDPH